MRRQFNYRRLGIYSVLGLVIVVAITIVFLNKPQPKTATVVEPKPAAEAPNVAGTAKPDEPNYRPPVTLIIPKLAINANVLPMGLTPDGDMESPATNEDTGWYRYGSRPGNSGSSVIAGHFGLRGEAVFGKLASLKKGDVISVIDESGSKVSFAVSSIKSFDKDSDSTEVFNSKEGAHLNLITCNGDWVLKQKTYTKRLIVFSDRIDTPATNN